MSIYNRQNPLGKMIYQARQEYSDVQLERRIEVLKAMRLVNDKPTSYGKFLHDYIRSMSFTYHATGGKAEKYRRVIKLVEEMASNQWKTFPKCK